MRAINHADRRLSQMAGLAVIAALVVIALGAFTRLLDAGLGCPDWPGCYGRLLPSDAMGAVMWQGTPFVAYKAWSEMIHRYAVSVLGFMMCGIVLRIFSSRLLRTAQLSILAVGLIVLLAYQVLLGQWTVTLRLWPVVVTQHLLGGFLILSLLWLIFINATRSDRTVGSRRFFWAGLVVLLLLFTQIALGAWTSTNYASLSCPDFPFCQNTQALHLQLRAAFQWMPSGINYDGGVLSEAARQTIQMTHRFGALVVSMGLLALSIGVLLRPLTPAAPAAYAILALLPIQVCLGIINVLFHLPVLTAVCHTVVAALLLLAVMTVVRRSC